MKDEQLKCKTCTKPLLAYSEWNPLDAYCKRCWTIQKVQRDAEELRKHNRDAPLQYCTCYHQRNMHAKKGKCEANVLFWFWQCKCTEFKTYYGSDD